MIKIKGRYYPEPKDCIKIADIIEKTLGVRLNVTIGPDNKFIVEQPTKELARTLPHSN